MNPIAYRPTLQEDVNTPLWFLLTGEMAYYRDGRHPQRIWQLNIYSTARGRGMAEKKMKRGQQDIIFIEWETTVGQIINQGKMVFPMASEKVLLSDKLDILRQLQHK